MGLMELERKYGDFEAGQALAQETQVWMMKTERAGAWPSQTRRSRDNPEPLPQSRSFSRYQSIPSASNGERNAGPPGRSCEGRG